MAAAAASGSAVPSMSSVVEGDAAPVVAGAEVAGAGGCVVAGAALVGAAAVVGAAAEVVAGAGTSSEDATATK